MKLDSFQIDNFRSIDHLEVTGLGPLVVLIGRNSAGKSNVLEALTSVFQNFDVAGGATPGLDEYVFYRRQTTKPARFSIVLRLSEAEQSSVFPPAWQDYHRSLLQRGPEGSLDRLARVTIVRDLTFPQGNWKTPRILWGDLPIVVDGVQATPTSLAEAAKKILASLEAEVRKVPIPAATPGSGGLQEAAQARILEAVASATPDLDLPPPFQQADITAVLASLVKLVKGRFRLISIARDVKTPGVLRDIVVDPQSQQQLWTLDQSTKADDEASFRRIEEAFRDITGERLDLVAGRAYVQKISGRFPLSSEGGGIQSALNLTSTIFTTPESFGIYALEEPETHAHPELQRAFLKSVRRLSERAQIFLATHSSIFVDRVNPGSLFLAKVTNNGTKLEKPSEYLDVLKELGTKPSDLLFANKLLFVEGKSDAVAVRAMATGAGLDFSDIQVMPADGKGGVRGRLKSMLEYAKDSVVPFALVDQDGRSEADKCVRDKLVPRDSVLVLSRGTMEDYYPPEVIEKAVELLDSRFDLGIRDSGAWKKWQAGALKVAQIDLGKKTVDLGGGWKVVLAEAVGKEFEQSVAGVPDELISFLRKVALS